VNKDINISIVIPTYNAEKSIYLLLESLFKELNLLKLSFEIIIVDDNSTDDTINEIKKFKNNSETVNITVIKSSSNYGQVTSTLFGVSRTKGKKILTIDDDLQHDPVEIKNLYDHLFINKLDSVVAYWKVDENLVRNVSSVIFNFLSNILQFKNPRYRNTAFRLFDSKLKDKFIEYFLDKNWIDIRRISKLNDQLMTIHNPPLKRKHTGFIKRVKLALHYFFLDTYFFELITILLIFLLDELFVIIIFLTIVVKKVTRYRLYKLRKNLFLNSDNYQIY